MLRPSQFTSAQIEKALADEGVEAHGPWLAHADQWRTLRENCAALINTEHRENPERPGLPLDKLRPQADRAFDGKDVFDDLL